jgi:hypothetical protein
MKLVMKTGYTYFYKLITYEYKKTILNMALALGFKVKSDKFNIDLYLWQFMNVVEIRPIKL